MAVAERRLAKATPLGLRRPATGHCSPIMTARYSEFADAERRWAFARTDITNGLTFPNAR